jgi:hypothetical protein
MTLILELQPEIERGLLAQAAARGVSPDELVTEFVVQRVHGSHEPAASEMSPAGQSLHEFFMNSPLRGANLDLERQGDYPRTVDLG